MIHIYDSHHRGPCPSERVEQINAMSWLSVHHADRYELVCHVPNESRGTAMHYAMRAKEGVKAGIPDILDLGGPILGMFEMKRLDRTKSSVSPDQKRILGAAAASGAFVAICYGAENFKLAYTAYVALCFAQQNQNKSLEGVG